MKYKEVYGNLITLAKNGEFDVIVHGCNCLSNMGAGLAPQMADAFGCDQFEMEKWGQDIQKLGCIDWENFVIGKNSIWNLKNSDNKENDPELSVVNAYTQYKYGRNHKDGIFRPIDYDALTLCFRKMNVIFKGKHIGVPQIGAGLAGGTGI